MNHNTRYLTGTVECACRYCAPSGSTWRAHVKRDTRRAVRHSERSEILQSLRDDNDHDGDAAYMIQIMRLNLDNVRALRTLPDGIPWQV